MENGGHRKIELALKGGEMHFRSNMEDHLIRRES